MKKQKSYIGKWLAPIIVALLLLMVVRVDAEVFQNDTVKQERTSEVVKLKPSEKKKEVKEPAELKKSSKSDKKKTPSSQIEVLNRGMIMHNKSMINI